jgi:small subunit ribosomal protein S15
VADKSTITTPLTEVQRKEQLKMNAQRYEEEQMMLPEDLRGQYRFGIAPSEGKKLPHKLQRVLSLKSAKGSEINSYRVRKYVEKFGYHIADTGNSAVQVAVLTMRINNLLERAKKHVTDRHNKYRLNILIQRRKGLLMHLKKSNLDLYYQCLKTIKLKDQVEIYATKLV